MTATAKPTNVGALAHGATVHANRAKAAELTEAGQAWVSGSGTLSGQPHTGGYTSTGRMPDGDERNALRDASYIVRSYGTPIAWRTPGQGWTYSAERYSVTTSRHQSIARGITR